MSDLQASAELDAFEYEQWDKIRANLPGICVARKRKLDSGAESGQRVLLSVQLKRPSFSLQCIRPI